MISIQTPSLKYTSHKEFFILDQTRLPEKEIWVSIQTPLEMAQAIQSLKVRGANLIGITAALSLAQAIEQDMDTQTLKSQCKILEESRPTAIHLKQACSRVMSQQSRERQIQEAFNIYKEDQVACEQMAQVGQSVIQNGDGILTYCNTGSLATGGLGTALGVIKQAHADKKNIFVYACETRPVNQGSRLTFWELQQAKIPSALLCDNMVASLMSQSKIQKVLVGADRISSQHDVANKIGTLNLAIVARYFKIPFYVVAPTSSFDSKLLKGSDIPIEQRGPQEVSLFWAKKQIYNPSFDITPRSLITGIITEKAILK
ncbi:MAG: S-methyl-5-thioribose-1-phosphate isomerase [Bdellovibrionales bacterium]